MLRTFPIVGKSHLALLAIFWQCIVLRLTKLDLLRRFSHFPQSLLHDVAEAIFGIDKVITGIEVSVMLDGERGTAGFAKNAQAGFHAQPHF